MAHRTFSPSLYYTTLGAHPPVLRIVDGDTVSTTTVDAAGCDFTGTPITHDGNPQTGPFFVEGAEPGDCLAVTFVELTPNRTSGYVSRWIAPHVLAPGAGIETESPDDRIEWELDLGAGTAHPVADASVLACLHLSLEPVLGCFGVAPPGGQFISTATASSHGGNMDYRGFVAGTTVYLNVA